MESYRALRGARGDGAFQRCNLSAGDLQRLQLQILYAPTAVFLLTETDLDKLAATWDGAISNRGRKLAAKSLAYYLARRTGMVRICTGYTEPGQAERGVRALVTSPEMRPRGAVFFIGLAPRVFEALWLRATAGEPATPAEATDLAGTDTDQLRLLLDANPRLAVPEALRRAYVGSSAEADGVRRRILLAARVKHAVLIEGETGTGKEVVARMIHQFSDRAAEAFIPVNCGGIPSELFESELFGHIKGAFTGALRDKRGLWTLARAGTLFLDEVGDLSPLHQVKVLRAIEDGRYRAVGGEQELASDARIIAATNRDLRQMVLAGRFREDLFYRLFTLRIRTPALREHRSDIPELARHFWRRLTERGDRGLPDEVLEHLKGCPWPGNAREMRSFLTTLFVIADGEPVTVSMVRAVLRDRLGRAGGSADATC